MRAKQILALSIIALFPAAVPAEPLGVASDASHRWELRWDSVSLRDAATSASIREFTLEGAAQTRSRDFCPPGLTLTPTGIAYVTSNIQPVVWRIDPATGGVERLELAVDSHQGRDFGFSGLRPSADGQTLHAVASSDRALWHLDPAARTARWIGTTPEKATACPVT